MTAATVAGRATGGLRIVPPELSPRAGRNACSSGR